jgi:long-chain acyl-CoA synthetase
MAGSGRVVTYAELDRASNQFAHHLRSVGLQRGDHVAVLLPNRMEFFESTWGALRAGLYLTPINWHLRSGEAGYIVADCGARALVVSADLADTVADLGRDLDGVELRLVAGGDIDGFQSYEAALAKHPGAPIGDESAGMWMFYSSGTTGRPKGIEAPLHDGPVGAPTPFDMLLTGLYGFSADTVYLSPSPLYHAAPAGWTNGTQRIGGTVVVMETFDPAAFLSLIERYRVTHTQVVPTHLVRLLKLPEEERRRYDLSSLQSLVHAAAPCPVEVKRSVIDWLGPIVHEYYAGSEGNGFCAIGPGEWLSHPGSVGRNLMGTTHVCDRDGNELPPGREGQVWFESDRRFEYHGDPEKTRQAFDARGWSTLGDVGWLDQNGYLYLTDRVTNMVISGGVNIYPREIEDRLIMHPIVQDAAVLGVPDADMGERLKAFVQLVPGVTTPDDVEATLIGHCRAGLSGFKCPREVEVVDELPRLPTGKLLKRLLPR